MVINNLFLKKKQLLGSLFFALFLFLAGSFFFFCRYPSAFLYPNFFCEDGLIFLENIYKNGFVKSLFTPFNGMCVLGIYLLEGLGLMINQLMGGSFVNIPRSFAIVLFFWHSFLAMAPYLFLSKKYGKFSMFLCAIFLWFTPCFGVELIVFSSIGDTKFTFLFLATILILYFNDRSICDNFLKRLLCVIGLLICFFTTFSSCVLIPLLFLPCLNKLKKKKNWFNFKDVFFKKDLIPNYFLLAVAIIYLFSMFFIADILEMQKVLDSPVEWKNFPYLLFASSLYGIFPLVGFLFQGNLISISIVGIIIFFMFLCFIIFLIQMLMKRLYVDEIIVISYAMLANVFVFVAGRPGVVRIFPNLMKCSGMNFFLSGPMLMIFLLFIFLSRYLKNVLGTSKKGLLLFISITYLLMMLPFSQSTRPFSRKNVNIKLAPTLKKQVEEMKKNDVRDKYVVLRILPPIYHWPVERQIVFDEKKGN